MKIFRNVRVIILIIAIVLAIAAINPRPWQTGVTIRSVDRDSAAYDAGISPSDPKITPVLRDRIISINGEQIKSDTDYYALTNSLPPNVSVSIQTNKQTYVVTTRPLLNITELPELEHVNITQEEFNNDTGKFENVSSMVWRNKTKTTVIGTEPLGISIYNAPTSNIRLGLDLSGGARVLLKPERPLTKDEMDLVIGTLSERLNVFGLSDIVVQPVTDLSGNQFVLIEVAGVSEKDVQDLSQKQGKFEAKIGNETAFGGGQDITYVCRSPQCSGIGQQQGCQQSGSIWSCGFQFQITLTPAAAKRQAALTSNLAVVSSPSGQFLEKPIDLFLDDVQVDSLQIGASLKGNPVTDISISGSGNGTTEVEAYNDALNNMKQLQTILQTGSLPVKMDIVKTDAVSAELGDQFIKNAIFVGFLAFLSVTIVMGVRYRNPRVSIPVIVTLLSELIIIFGVAALFGQNLDLAAFAGIIVAIGTGVDDQIVIADETIGSRKKRHETMNWRDKINKAFFIILASYFTAMASLIPLMFAGAGLVRGFAITTMIGISAGVLITRPAFAAIMEKLEGDDDK